MSEPLLFMFFSTIETFSLYFLIMSLFRFKWQQHAWQALTVILLLNLQSYLLRNELDLASISPVILILIFIVFFAAVVKMPLIISIIATISGFVIFVVIQTLLIFMLFGSLDNFNQSTENGYILQLVTAIVSILLFKILYMKGKGFTFDIEKLRMVKEDVVLTITIIGILPAISLLLFFNEIYLNIVIFTAMAAYLLYYSRKKENES